MNKNRSNAKRLHTAIVVIFFLVLALFITVKVFSYITTNGEGPVITFDRNEIKVKTSVKDEKLLEGVTAKDEKGNDVTDTIMIESFSKLLDGNKRIVNYIAYDANNNIGKANRTIIYKDYKSPQISLKQSSEFYTEDGYVNILDYIKVKDRIDGEIGKKAQVLETEYVDKEQQNYKIAVTNSCGDTVETTIPVTVHSSSNIDSLPFVKLDKYMIYIDKGDDFDAWSHVEALTVGKSIYQIEGKTKPISSSKFNYVNGIKVPRSAVSISGKVDTEKKGTYKVTYKANYNGKKANTALLVVVQ
ncbi:MAG: bacterial Ig-like domain-containing protein [Lachnospiraceae bacterium]|nr:bacterial Ig-like domain-containing protein [Lachnospiraceae bacterium]